MLPRCVLASFFLPPRFPLPPSCDQSLSTQNNMASPFYAVTVDHANRTVVAKPSMTGAPVGLLMVGGVAIGPLHLKQLEAKGKAAGLALPDILGLSPFSTGAKVLVEFEDLDSHEIDEAQWPCTEANFTALKLEAAANILETGAAGCASDERSAPVPGTGAEHSSGDKADGPNKEESGNGGGDDDESGAAGAAAFEKMKAAQLSQMKRKKVESSFAQGVLGVGAMAVELGFSDREIRELFDSAMQEVGESASAVGAAAAGEDHEEGEEEGEGNEEEDDDDEAPAGHPGPGMPPGMTPEMLAAMQQGAGGPQCQQQ